MKCFSHICFLMPEVQVKYYELILFSSVTWDLQVTAAPALMWIRWGFVRRIFSGSCFSQLKCLCSCALNTMWMSELTQTCCELTNQCQWRCFTWQLLTSEIRGWLFRVLSQAEKHSRPININWTVRGCRNNLCKFINWGLFTWKQFVDEVSVDQAPAL